MPNFDNVWQVLIRRSQTSTLQNITNDFALQTIRQKRAFICQRAIAVPISRDCREMPAWIVKRSDYFCGVGDQEFLPYGAFVLLTDCVGIGGKPLRLGKVRELLIVEPCGGTKRAGGHDVAHGRVFIREAAL